MLTAQVQKKKRVAMHEAGHAMMQDQEAKAYSYIQVGIVDPRVFGEWTNPTGTDNPELKRQRLRADVRISMAGRIAEIELLGLSDAWLSERWGCCPLPGDGAESDWRQIHDYIEDLATLTGEDRETIYMQELASVRNFFGNQRIRNRTEALGIYLHTHRRKEDRFYRADLEKRGLVGNPSDLIRNM